MQTDRWTVPRLAREATKNVFALRSRMYGALLFAIVVGVAISLYSSWESSSLEKQLAHEDLSGRNVIEIASIDPTKPAAITRSSCDALAVNSDVTTAGFAEDEGTIDIPQIGTSVPLMAASPSLVPDLRTAEVVVGDTLRKSGPIFRLRMPDGSVQTATVGESQPDVIGTNSSVVIALPPVKTTASTCIVKLSPLADEHRVAARLVAELRSTGGPLSATYPFSEPQDPIHTFLTRPERFLPLLLALAGGIMTVVVNRLRAGEWASYRLSGTSVRSLLVLQLLEQAAIGGCLVTAAAFVVVVFQPSYIDASATILTALCSALLWMTVVAVGSLDIAFKKPTNLAKDR